MILQKPSLYKQSYLQKRDYYSNNIENLNHNRIICPCGCGAVNIDDRVPLYSVKGILTPGNGLGEVEQEEKKDPKEFMREMQRGSGKKYFRNDSTGFDSKCNTTFYRWCHPEGNSSYGLFSRDPNVRTNTTHLSWHGKICRADRADSTTYPEPGQWKNCRCCGEELDLTDRTYWEWKLLEENVNDQRDTVP